MDQDIFEKEQQIMRIMERLSSLRNAEKLIQNIESDSQKNDPPQTEVDQIRYQLKSVSATLREVMHSLSQDLAALKEDPETTDDLP